MSTFNKIYKSVVKESAMEGANSTYSIGNELYRFLEDLEDDARLKSGESAKVKLKEIIDELNDIVGQDRYDRDDLARILKMD